MKKSLPFQSVYAVLLSVCLSQSVQTSQAASVDTARQWYSRLTGLPAGPTHPVIVDMAKALDAGDKSAAADLALAEDGFINIVVRQLATPMANRTADPFYELNDFTAAFMGVVRDNVDARELLRGNFRYEAASPLNLPAVSRDNNEHYLKLDATGVSLRKTLTKVSPQWKDGLGGGGLLTTRGWAEAHYNAGTNRRAMAMALENFLCRPITTMRDTIIPDDRVRKDIDRSPAGKPKDYQQTCRGCHAGMDPMAGAFANVDFVGTSFMIFEPFKPVPKYKQNEKTYSDGYRTVDNSWENYWFTYGSAQNLGWRGPQKGNGIADLGSMLAETEAFGKCMARRVVAQVCRLAGPDSVGDGTVTALSQIFENSGFHMKTLYREAIRLPDCL